MKFQTFELENEVQMTSMVWQKFNDPMLLANIVEKHVPEMMPVSLTMKTKVNGIWLKFHRLNILCRPANEIRRGLLHAQPLWNNSKNSEIFTVDLDIKDQEH